MNQTSSDQTEPHEDSVSADKEAHANPSVETGISNHAASEQDTETSAADIEKAGHDEAGQTRESDASSAAKPGNNVKINGEPMLKLPDDLYIPPDALEVFLETFQGPFDLLLYLIRKQNLDILNIPVALITRQYMEYVELMRQFRLDLASEYLVMAATLAEIKSRMLLPRPVTDEENDGDDPRATLIRRLQEYERFSKAAQELEERPRMERDLFLMQADFEDPAPVKVLPRATLNDLLTAFRNVIDSSDRNKHWVVDHERLTVREKMTSIIERVNMTKVMRFEELFDPKEGRFGLVICFIAILEMCRDNMLVIVQNEPFSTIHLKSNEGE